MPGGNYWNTSPRKSIDNECARRGRAAVVAGCVDLLTGRDCDEELVRALAGPAADKFFDGAAHHDDYWFRVWAARGLYWVWDDNARPALIAATRDPSWRVREMVARVVARHLVGDAIAAVAELRDDPVSRVRAAAQRAVVRLTDAGA